jgi:hypothetical protein
MCGSTGANGLVVKPRSTLTQLGQSFSQRGASRRPSVPHYCIGIGSGSAQPSARGSEPAEFLPVSEL